MKTIKKLQKEIDDLEFNGDYEKWHGISFRKAQIKIIKDIIKLIDNLENEEWGDDVIFASELKEKIIGK